MRKLSTNLPHIVAAALALSLAGAGMASAQQSQSPSGSQQSDPMPSATPPGGASGQTGQAPSKALENATQAQKQMEQLAAQGEKLVGKQVIGANNEEIGEVSDVVIGQDGKLKAVLLKMGGMLGLGAKTVALPIEELRPEGDKIMAAKLTKEQVEAMPEYKEQQGEQGQGQQQSK